MRSLPLQMFVMALAVMGMVSTELAAQTAIWHRDGGVSRWDLRGYHSDWPAPFWGAEADPPGPAEELTIQMGVVYPYLAGYAWIETTWLDQQSVPPVAPTLAMTSEENVLITPLPGYPYLGAENLSWTYGWELDPQPHEQTLTFPNADYFHLDNGLASVEFRILHGIEFHLWWHRDTTLEVWNRSLLPANDFHLKLDVGPFMRLWRIESSDYASAAVEQTDTGCEITWEEGATESDTSSRFRVGYEQLVRDHASTESAMQWTQDGSVIATLPDVWPEYWMLSEHEIRADITNRSQPGETVWIQRRVLDWDYWHDWILLDPEPVELLPGESLLHDFGPWHAEMEYDVFEDDDGTPGQLLVTFSDTTYLFPEPGTLTLLFFGGLTMGGLATIRHRTRSMRRKRRLHRQLGEVL